MISPKIWDAKLSWSSDKISPDAQLTTIDWNDIYNTWKVYRELQKWNEKHLRLIYLLTSTLMEQVKVQLIPDIGFFDHMLEQIARHGNIDINIDVKGDLHIDEHHTIEDVAITLGEAVLQALGGKKSIER